MTQNEILVERQPTPMASTAWFDRFKTGDEVTPADHVRIFWSSPSARSAAEAVDYLWTTRLIRVEASAIYAAVKNGELPAFRIGKGLVFKPCDLDAWLDSRRINA